MQTLVGIMMGSASDLPLMKEAAAILESFEIPFEINVLSAHRTPDKAMEYAANAAKRGLKVMIAGAGGAAHLPGVVAAFTPLPVIGVPVKSANSMSGLDSLLSIAQMPGGVPVATVAIDGAMNAGILAAQIIGTGNPEIQKKVIAYKEKLKEKIYKSAEETNKLDFKFQVKYAVV
jgi:5-(carboxyamino)imidazole ribonucleotide mutase